MRTGHNDSSRKEAAFKAINESKKSKAPSKNHLEILDDVEAFFIKKLERGTDKYKGKLPLKCFSCGRIRGFASKCPYSKQDDSDKREVSKKFKKGKNRNKRKIIYTMEDSEDEDTSGDEETKIILMGIDTQAQNGESNEESIVDLKNELITTLEEL